MHRTGNCTIKQQEKGITVKADLGIKSMVASFRGSAYALTTRFAIGVDIEAKVEHLRILAEIYQDHGPSSHGILRDFDILHMDLDMHVNGLGPLGWIINPLLRATRKLFRSKIDDLVEDRVQKAIAKMLLKYHLPFGY